MSPLRPTAVLCHANCADNDGVSVIGIDARFAGAELIVLVAGTGGKLRVFRGLIEKMVLNLLSNYTGVC